MKAVLFLAVFSASLLSVPSFADTNQSGYDLAYPAFQVKILTSDGAPVEHFVADLYISGLQYGVHPDCDDNGINNTAGVCSKWETLFSQLLETDSNGVVQIPANHLVSSDANWSNVSGTLTPAFGISIPGCVANYLIDTETVTCDSKVLSNIPGAGLGFVVKDRSTNSQIPAQLNCTLPVTKAALAAQIAQAQAQCPTE